MTKFFKREENKPYTYSSIEVRKSSSKPSRWIVISTLVVISIIYIVFHSPMRSKAEYLGYRLGIFVIESCIEFGLPPQGGVVCSYKFDPLAIWAKLTYPKKVPVNLPETD